VLGSTLARAHGGRRWARKNSNHRPLFRGRLKLSPRFVRKLGLSALVSFSLLEALWSGPPPWGGDVVVAQPRIAKEKMASAPNPGKVAIRPWKSSFRYGARESCSAGPRSNYRLIPPFNGRPTTQHRLRLTRSVSSAKHGVKELNDSGAGSLLMSEDPQAIQ